MKRLALVLCALFASSLSAIGCGSACADLSKFDCGDIKDAADKSACEGFKKGALSTNNDETCKVTLNAQSKKAKK